MTSIVRKVFEFIDERVSEQASLNASTDLSPLERIGGRVISAGATLGTGTVLLPEQHPVYPLMGFGNDLIGSWQGMVDTARAGLRFFQSKEEKDRTGEREAFLDAGRAITQAISGVSFAVYRTLSAVAMILPHLSKQTQDIVQTSNRIATEVSRSANIVGAVSYFFQGAWALFMEYKTSRFSSKFHAAKDKMAFLDKKINVTAEEVLYKLRKQSLSDLIEGMQKKEERAEAGEKAKQIDQIIKSLQLSPLQALEKREILEIRFFDADTREKIAQYVKTCLKECNEELDEETQCEIRNQILIDLGDQLPMEERKKWLERAQEMNQKLKAEMIRLPDQALHLREWAEIDLFGLDIAEQIDDLVNDPLRIQLEQLRQKKEQKLERFVNSRVVKKIKKGFQDSSKEEAVIRKVETALFRTRLVNWAIIFSCILGLATIPLMFVFPPGALLGILIIASLWVASSAFMLAADGYSLHLALESTDKAPWDNKILWISAGLSLLSLAAVVAVTFALSFAFLPMFFAIAITMGTLIMLVAVSVIAEKKRRKRLQKKHPDLDFFLKVLKEQRERLEKMRKNNLDVLETELKSKKKLLKIYNRLSKKHKKIAFSSLLDFEREVF